MNEIFLQQRERCFWSPVKPTYNCIRLIKWIDITAVVLQHELKNIEVVFSSQKKNYIFILSLLKQLRNIPTNKYYDIWCFISSFVWCPTVNEANKHRQERFLQADRKEDVRLDLIQSDLPRIFLQSYRSVEHQLEQTQTFKWLTVHVHVTTRCYQMFWMVNTQFKVVCLKKKQAV